MKKFRCGIFLLIILFSLVSCNVFHSHSYSKEWSYNSINHWHNSTCKHDKKKDLGEHVFNESKICSICGFEKIDWELKDLTVSSGEYLYLNSYAIITPIISPYNITCDQTSWNIKGNAQKEVLSNGSCRVSCNEYSKENDLVEISCVVENQEKKVVLKIKVGTIRQIDIENEKTGKINIQSTEVAVSLFGYRFYKDNNSLDENANISLILNARKTPLDIYINNALISSVLNESFITYNGSEKVNLYLNNASLIGKDVTKATISIPNLEIFTSNFCEIKGEDAKHSANMGGIAIQSNDLIINSRGTVDIYGGNGGNGANATNTGGTGGTGGVGGTAIKSINVKFNDINSSSKVSIFAGYGGSGGTGGIGESRSGAGIAGTGGTGGTGGDSGYCIEAKEIRFNAEINSQILFVSGNGGIGGIGGVGGIGDQAFLKQPSNGGRGGTGGIGGTSRIPFNENVQILGGTFQDYQRIIVNVLGMGGSGGIGGAGGNVDLDQLHPATGGTGGTGGAGGNIEELNIKEYQGIGFPLSYFWNGIKLEYSDGGAGGTGGGTTGNHTGSYYSGSSGTKGYNGKKVSITIIVNNYDIEAFPVN